MSDLAERPVRSDRTLPVLFVLFVGSGCAALIYEIVWFQLLQFVIGSSALSLGVLLGTFMGGMCLGSIALARLVGVERHPLRVYAALELGIGLIGIAVLFVLPLANGLYVASSSEGSLGFMMRGLVAAVCLLPPTLLMGATLPAIARWVEATPRGVSWLGLFYAGNIFGAVSGCLLAGFYLLRVYDMATATYVAAAINFLVAVIGFSLARRMPYAPPAITSSDETAAGVPRAWGVYLAIGLSGLTALGAEVIWTRLLSLMMGGTVYTFSIILAVFLIGLGIGSSAGAVIARRSDARLALGICQLLLAAAIAWTAYQLAQSLPYWPIDPALVHSGWHSFQLDLLRATWAMLPAATLWGASFPLALAAVATRGKDPGRLVGGVYAANTTGAILGAIGFSVVMVAWLGTQRAQQILIGLSAVSALVTLAPLVWSGGGEVSASPRSLGRPLARGAILLAALAVVAALAWSIPGTPGELIAHGRYLASRAGQDAVLYQGEGVNSSVAVTLRNDMVMSFHVSGKIEASNWPQDMRLQRMLGHVPALAHPKPKSVLVVGCGAGVTAGSFLVHPDVERVVVCEIEPLIPQVVAQYFGRENYNVVNDSRVKIVYDDARHFILTTPEKFDVITSDPIHPWVKGAAALYTKEYFELCKERLNAGGVITQWVPLYESNTAAVKSELATFFEVFPEGTVWSNDQGGQGYDVVLLGQLGPLSIDVNQLADRLGRGNHALVVESLLEVGFNSPLDLLATYAGAAGDLKPWLADGQINRDRNLRLQYLAGMGASNYTEAAIYDEMLRYRKYPAKLFVATGDAAAELRVRLGTPGSAASKQ